MLFAAFQLMFAAITPALITGAFAERKRFGAFVLFTILWSILVYSPIAHWVWSVDGWLFKLGALDFAGGTVVHISSGVSALVVALAHRPPRRQRREPMEPHDVPMTVLGAGLLWFGWFGFNAGSAVAAGGLAANAFVVTNTAAAAATITWVLASYLHKGKVSVVGAACGAVAGLVAITPASGFVTPGGALVIGLVAGGLCYSATLLRGRASRSTTRSTCSRSTASAACSAPSRPASSPPAPIQAAYTGLIDGNAGQVVTQLVAVGATVAYAVVATFVIVKVVDLILGIRVSATRRGGRASTSPSTARPPTSRNPGERRTGPAPPGPTARSLRPRPSDRLPSTPPGGGRSLHPLRRPGHGDPTSDDRDRRQTRRAALRPALRARCVRRRVRRGRRRPVARRGSCRWRSRDSPRWAIAGRLPPTASRATAPGSSSRLTGRCSR